MGCAGRSPQNFHSPNSPDHLSATSDEESASRFSRSSSDLERRGPLNRDRPRTDFSVSRESASSRRADGRTDSRNRKTAGTEDGSTNTGEYGEAITSFFESHENMDARESSDTSAGVAKSSNGQMSDSKSVYLTVLAPQSESDESSSPDEYDRRGSPSDQSARKKSRKSSMDRLRWRDESRPSAHRGLFQSPEEDNRNSYLTGIVWGYRSSDRSSNERSGISDSTRDRFTSPVSPQPELNAKSLSFRSYHSSDGRLEGGFTDLNRYQYPVSYYSRSWSLQEALRRSERSDRSGGSRSLVELFRPTVVPNWAPGRVLHKIGSITSASSQDRYLGFFGGVFLLGVLGFVFSVAFQYLWDVFRWIFPKTGSDDLEVREVPLESIHTNPFQVRSAFDEEELDRLAASIEERRVLSPIQVRETDLGTYELISGERRVRACRRLGRDKIPAMVRDLSDEEVLEVSLSTNIQRESLDAVDRARCLRNIREANPRESTEDLAKRLGVPSTLLDDCEWIPEGSPRVREALFEENISEATAFSMVGFSIQKQNRAFRSMESEDSTDSTINTRILVRNPVASIGDVSGRGEEDLRANHSRPQRRKTLRRELEDYSDSQESSFSERINAPP